jgi:hypothetical protein
VEIPRANVQDPNKYQIRKLNQNSIGILLRVKIINKFLKYLDHLIRIKGIKMHPLYYFFLSTKHKLYWIMADAIIVLIFLIYSLIDDYFRSTICPALAFIVEIILILWLFYLNKKLKKEEEEGLKSGMKDLELNGVSNGVREL